MWSILILYCILRSSIDFVQEVKTLGLRFLALQKLLEIPFISIENSHLWYAF